PLKLLMPTTLASLGKFGTATHSNGEKECPHWVISGHMQCTNPCPLYPRKRTCAVQLGMSAMGQKRTSPHYSITWSARAINAGDKLMPSAFAVFKLTTSSNFVGCSIGKSAGIVPLARRSI